MKVGERELEHIIQGVHIGTLAMHGEHALEALCFRANPEKPMWAVRVECFLEPVRTNTEALKRARAALVHFIGVIDKLLAEESK